MKISSHLTAQIRTVLSRLMSYFSKHVIVTRWWALMRTNYSTLMVYDRENCRRSFSFAPYPLELGLRFSSSLIPKQFFLPARNVFTYVPLIFTLYYKLHLQLGITFDFFLNHTMQILRIRGWENSNAAIIPF